MQAIYFAAYWLLELLRNADDIQDQTSINLRVALREYLHARQDFKPKF